MNLWINLWVKFEDKRNARTSFDAGRKRKPSSSMKVSSSSFSLIRYFERISSSPKFQWLMVLCSINLRRWVVYLGIVISHLEAFRWSIYLHTLVIRLRHPLVSSLWRFLSATPCARKGCQRKSDTGYVRIWSGKLVQVCWPSDLPNTGVPSEGTRCVMSSRRLIDFEIYKSSQNLWTCSIVCASVK